MSTSDTREIRTPVIPALRGQPGLHIEFYIRLEGRNNVKARKKKRRGDGKRKGNKQLKMSAKMQRGAPLTAGECELLQSYYGNRCARSESQM